MKEVFKIYVDRLQDQTIEKINIDVDPSFLEIQEPELVFKKNINILGKAYLADDNLVIDLNAKTYYNMPCVICNMLVENILDIKSYVQVIELDKIKNAVFDFSSNLRDEILLQIPQFTECNFNKCKLRNSMKKYFKNDNQGHFPFEELKL